MIVHLLSRLDPQSWDYLRGLIVPEVEITMGDVENDTGKYEILVTGRPERKDIEFSPNLRAVIIPWAGMPKKMRELMLEYPDIAVHNLHHHAGPAAELAFALLLAAAKFIVPMDRALRNHDWLPRYEPNPTVGLENKNALILGYGAIGQKVAAMCRGTGMHVNAIRQFPEKTPPGCPDKVYPPGALPDLLPVTTALIVCLPSTHKTGGMIGEHELDLLPDGAVLVNIGRGDCIVEKALYEALRNGKLHAAGIDVWYKYPRDKESRGNTQPSDYPFNELDNVVMSPHRAGALNNDEAERMRMEDLARLINAAAQGKSIPNKVNVEEGY